MLWLRCFVQIFAFSVCVILILGLIFPILLFNVFQTAKSLTPVTTVPVTVRSLDMKGFWMQTARETSTEPCWELTLPFVSNVQLSSLSEQSLRRFGFMYADLKPEFWFYFMWTWFKKVCLAIAKVQNDRGICPHPFFMVFNGYCCIDSALFFVCF